MTKQNLNIRGAFTSFGRLVANYPIVVLPYFFYAIINLLTLAVLYYFPRQPVAFFMAAPIRRLWGEEYLHYPKNFILLPRLYQHANTVLVFSIGILCTAIFIYISASLSKKKTILKEPVFIPALRVATLKYFPMLIFFAIYFNATQLLIKKMLAISAPIAQPGAPGSFVVQFMAVLLLGTVIQTVFAYIFQAMIVDRAGLLRSLVMNFRVLRRCSWQTLVVVFVVSGVFQTLLFVNQGSVAGLLARFEPEILVLPLAISGILRTLYDLVLTGVLTMMYLIYKQGEKEKEAVA